MTGNLLPEFNEKNITFLVFLTLFTALAALTSMYGFLLFHSVAELFSIIIAFAIFIIVWNGRDYIDDNYLLFLGIGYLFIGGLDFVHMLAYSGMNIFTGFNANLPTQLWIAARYIQAVTYILAPLLLFKKLNFYREFLIYMVVTLVILYSIFISGSFPDCYIEGEGLTPFKIYSEYVISAMFFVSLWLLYKKREYFEKEFLFFISASIVFTIASELAFTSYISVYGFSNMLGHICKIFSFGLLYYAIVEAGIRRPYGVIFRSLKQKEEELRIERNRLDQYLEIAEVIFLVLDREGKVRLVNRKGCEILGYEKNEIEGSDWFEKFLLPEERDGIRAAFKDVIEGNAEMHESLEGTVLTKSGEQRIILWQNSLVYDENKKIRGTLSSGEDITEKKRYERDLYIKNKAIETSIDGMVISDANRDIVYANPSFALMHGYDSVDEVLGLNATYFIADPAETEKIFNKIEKEGKFTGEIGLRKKSGEVIIDLISAYVVQPDDSAEPYLFVSMIDVTDKEKIKEALAAANSKLNILSSITRHDILNGVTAALGYLEMLEDAPAREKEDLIKKISAAVSQIKKQAEFTRDYQDMGMKSPVWQNPEKIILDYLASSGDYLGLDVKVDIGNIEIFTDPMLPKVFANIMSNSLVHGEHVSKIAISSLKGDSGNLIISIEDDGTGIPEEKRKSLFKPVTGREHGLGLYLVKEILSITDIEITESGVSGKGAKFDIDVPAGNWREA